MSFGSRLKERREQLGITQVQLAKMLGVTKGAIGNYETELNSPKASILYKVFEVLDCDANYLFQDEMNEYKTDAEKFREYASSYNENRLNRIASMNIKDKELDLIFKYRTLDDHGTDVVDVLLEKEYLRCKSIPQIMQDKNPLDEWNHRITEGEEMPNAAR